MDDINFTWHQLIHDYRKLERRGLLGPLQCEVCSSDVAVRLGPLLECYECGTSTDPGLVYMQKIEQLVGALK